jgi:GMP synthase-like glutamine amidotransferase
MLIADGFQIETVNAQRDRIPVDIEQYSGVVLLGGPMAAYDNVPYLTREQELIRAAIEEELPVLGICLGSQLIAQATGGRVYRGKKKEIGWHDVSLTSAGRSDLFSGIDSGESMKVFQWHGDTYDLPTGARILANSDMYPQAFRIDSAVGIQFHLEVDTGLIQTWTRKYHAELEAEKIKPQDLFPKEEDIDALHAKCKQVYANFSKALVAHRGHA